MKQIASLWAALLCAALFLVSLSPLWGWIDDRDPTWPDGTVTLRLQLAGAPVNQELGTTFNDVAAGAAREWNRYLGRVQISPVHDLGGPRGEGGADGRNQVFFSTRLWGQDIGANVLAVTIHSVSGGRRAESDVAFNTAHVWDAYAGSLRPAADDLRRIALHEFGHVLGLGHPDGEGQSVNAIMNSRVSAADHLYEDDILGGYALYGAGPDTPIAPPVITSESEDATLRIESDLFLFVTATGAGLRYQWQRDGVDLAGKTTPNFGIFRIQLDQGGVYRCRVSSPFGAVLSREMRVVVLPWLPSISWVQGIGMFVPGTYLIHEVEIRGDGPFTVEWLRDGLPVRRAQQAAAGRVLFEIQKPAPADAGVYAVRVNGPGGTVTTSAVPVRSFGGFPPRVAWHPSMSAAQAGTAVTLEASSIDGFTAEWMKDGSHFAPTTPQQSRLTLVVSEETAGTYHVRYHNGGGFTDSMPVYIAPAPPEIPVILRAQGGTRFAAGGNINLSVVWAGSGPHTFRWTHNGQPLGATGAQLSTPATLAAAGTYRCEVATTAGAAAQEWEVQVVEPPRTEVVHIVTHPTSCDRIAGESLFLFVETDGANHAGQWFRDGQALNGANGLSYSKQSLGPADAGEYWFECPAESGGLLRSEKAIVRVAATASSVDTIFREHPAELAFSTHRVRILRAGVRYDTTPFQDAFWEKDGVRVPDSRSDLLSTATLGPAPEGTYVYVVQRASGEQRSRPARLVRITPRPPTVAGPDDLVLYGLGYNYLLLGAQSWDEPVITWFKNGQPIASGMADLPAVGVVDEYHAVVSSGGGEVRSRTARVSRGVLPWPVRITRDPESLYRSAGAPAVLRVETNLPEVSCQWREDGVPIAGATGREFTTTAGLAGTRRQFDVLVSAGDMTVASRPAIVEAAPDLPSPSVLAFVRVPEMTRVAAGATLRLLPEVQYGVSWFFATHQWFKDGVALPHATGPTLVVPGASAEAAGTYRLRLSKSGEPSIDSADMRVEVVPSARLANISARAHAGTGDAIVIPSFVVTGEGERRLMVRVAGDTLYPSIPTALRDPVLQFKRLDGTLLDQDDDWEIDPVRGETLAQLMQARCGGVLKRGSKDAALLRSVPAGNYTPHVSGKNLTTGVAVTEVFDLTDGDVPARVVNMAARAKVEAGDGLLILGFVIGPGEPRRLMITGIGPTLAAAGVAGALADPKLTLYDGAGKEVGSNDNWSADATEARALEEAFLQTGAGYLARDTLDAAMIVTLPPGAYSAHVRDTQGRTGIAISELWELP